MYVLRQGGRAAKSLIRKTVEEASYFWTGQAVIQKRQETVDEKLRNTNNKYENLKTRIPEGKEFFEKEKQEEIKEIKEKDFKEAHLWSYVILECMGITSNYFFGSWTKIMMASYIPTIYGLIPGVATIATEVMATGVMASIYGFGISLLTSLLAFLWPIFCIALGLWLLGEKYPKVQKAARVILGMGKKSWTLYQLSVNVATFCFNPTFFPLNFKILELAGTLCFAPLNFITEIVRAGELAPFQGPLMTLVWGPFTFAKNTHEALVNARGDTFNSAQQWLTGNSTSTPAEQLFTTETIDQSENPLGYWIQMLRRLNQAAKMSSYFFNTSATGESLTNVSGLMNTTSTTWLKSLINVPQ